MSFLEETIKTVFAIDSPSGFYANIDDKLQEILTGLGYKSTRSNKGNVIVEIEGVDNTKTVATSAHVDTLGLMVRSINSDGTLSLTKVGGPSTPTLDGEYVTIMTRSGVSYTGTCLSKSSSVHVYKDANSRSRDIDELVVRIDEVVKTKEDVLKLGIENGDYIFIDPKTTITKSKFLKSRFIDDKASVCVILDVLRIMKENKVKPKYRTFVYFVNHEEVGHGASTISHDISEFVTVDMGCVGLDLDGNEFAVSIAAKDGMGPYDYYLNNRLIGLAKSNSIDYVIDIFPFYGSDVGASWRAGVDCAGALIGPGVNASHGMERTHLSAMEATTKLLYLYLV